MAKKYIIKDEALDITMKMINKKGEVVVLSDKGFTEKVEESRRYPNGTRDLKPATQDDLEYFYETLKARKFIDKVDTPEVQESQAKQK